MPEPLPPNFEEITLGLFGERGRAWLADLPAQLARLEERWSIRVLPPYELSYNYVAPAVRPDGTRVVLKLGVPNPEMMSEMESLRHYAGRGIVMLLESDPDEGAMLLEELSPGVTLADFANDLLHGDPVSGDEVATRIAAQVMQELWIPAPPNPHNVLLTAESWTGGFANLRMMFGGGTGPFPPSLIERAERTYTDINTSHGPYMLLHGDLHHWNILSSTRRPWLALDPKGVIAEAEFEIGPWLINRWPENASRSDLQRQAARRLAIFSEMLGFDRARLKAHTFARMVLSAWWSYEDLEEINILGMEFAEAVWEMK
jgi:streptomycin 6-kinase